jgi:hypothetical protein
LSTCVQWYPPVTVGSAVNSAVKVAYFLSQYGGSIGVVIFLLGASNGKITNFAKPRFGAFEVFLERRNELAEVHFCLNMSNDIHRYLSALVSNLVSGVIFLSQHAGLVRVAMSRLEASNGKLILTYWTMCACYSYSE